MALSQMPFLSVWTEEGPRRGWKGDAGSLLVLDPTTGR